MLYHAHNKRRWNTAGLHYLADFVAVIVGFVISCELRFNADYTPNLMLYVPGVMLAALVLPSVFYVGGLYTSTWTGASIWRRLGCLVSGILACLMIIFTVGAIDASLSIGRGVLAISFMLITFFTVLHHIYILGKPKIVAQKSLVFVSNRQDEKFVSFIMEHASLIRVTGVIVVGDYPYKGPVENVSNLNQFSIKGLEGDTQLLMNEELLANAEVTSLVRRARYEGISMNLFVDVYEELFHSVPLSMVTERWLHHASSQCNVDYMRRYKRLFDVGISLLVLTLASPLLLLGMLLIKLNSPGPIFFRQERMGKAGRIFEVIKLRSMHLDAEKDGPQWASSNDNRAFTVGKWLRKFRIDEIPQLFNVLKGEMSFVGPRPERKFFVDSLEKKIPYFRERLLVQPGLTGWAQVRYPYGANELDAWRKTELDLYYIKNMSLLLDFFILLETIRTVLTGGRTAHAAEISKQSAWKTLSPTLFTPECPAKAHTEASGITLS